MLLLPAKMEPSDRFLTHAKWKCSLSYQTWRQHLPWKRM